MCEIITRAHGLKTFVRILFNYFFLEENNTYFVKLQNSLLIKVIKSFIDYSSLFFINHILTLNLLSVKFFLRLYLTFFVHNQSCCLAKKRLKCIL